MFQIPARHEHQVQKGQEGKEKGEEKRGGGAVESIKYFHAFSHSFYLYTNMLNSISTNSSGMNSNDMNSIDMNSNDTNSQHTNWIISNNN